jgi:hypothetical protein
MRCHLSNQRKIWGSGAVSWSVVGVTVLTVTPNKDKENTTQERKRE